MIYLFRAELSLCSVTWVCLTEVSVIHTSLKINYAPYIYTIKPKFWGNPVGKPMWSGLFLVTTLCVCVCPPEIVSPDQCFSSFFEEEMYFECL